MSNKDLPGKILWQIYTSYPFPLEDIESAYSRLKSYDALVAACEVAKKEEYKTLSDYITKRFKPTSGSPQERLIALLDEIGIENWVGGIPHKRNEPEKGWEVIIPQDDIEDSRYYRYTKFTFNVKGEFVELDIDGEWKEPDEPV
jgi:hypothetical protein